MTVLHNGGTFPALEIPAVGGGTISLPTDLAGSYGVVLVYRGSWCPYCNAQLAAFSLAEAAFTTLGIKTVALSTDDETTAAAFADQHHISFPLGHSADPDTVATATGAYTNHDPRYLQPTGFVLAPDSTVLTAVYSSGAIGRLIAGDVTEMIKYVRSL